MFETRERAEETRFAHEHDVDFQALARRDRMFGRWAAHLMGMNGQAIENYARYLVMAEVAGATDEYVLQTVKQNLAECGIVGVKASEDRLRRKLERLHAIARAHFRADQ